MAEKLEEVPDEAIQNYIHSFSIAHNRKVALIALKVSNLLQSSGILVDQTQFERRFDLCLLALVEAGKLETFGDTRD